MNFQSMHYFLQVAEKRSFSQAAETLYITQQSLSASIAALEKELGCPLFVRHVPLELTYGGEVFLQYAQDITRLRDRLLRDFDEIRAEERGRLRIGVTINRGRLLMPSVVHAFHRDHPKVETEIGEEINDRLLTALEEGRIDLAVANFPEKTRGIRTEFFFREELVLAVSEALLPASLRARKENGTVTLRGEEELLLLSDVPLLLSGAGTASGRITRELIRKSGIRPSVRASSGNMEALIRMCVLGEGALFCPRSLLEDPQEMGTVVFRLPGEEMRYDVSFGWLKEEKEWSIRRAFMETAKQVFPKRRYPEHAEETSGT